MVIEVDIDKIISILEFEYKKWDVPVVTLIAIQKKSPFHVLLATIISLRTKDEVTINASQRLFKILDKPEDIYNLNIEQIEKAIYPCGFYKRKAVQIIEISKRLVEEFNSIVPKEIDTLLTFNGIGRKTANLVLTEGYGIDAMCVDVHVHRVSNRIGYIKTKNPEMSEFALRKKLLKKYWIRYNFLLVAFGQGICRPVSPKCSICPIEKLCNKIDVKIHR